MSLPILMLDKISEKVENNRACGIYRKIPNVDAFSNNTFQDKTSRFINLATNDYLGLALNGKVKESAKKALDAYGTSSSASFLIWGHSKIHRNLEDKLRTAKGGYEGCILYPSGYQANSGVIKCMSNISLSDTFITFDELSHASIIDGVLSSGAKFKSFKHNDMGDLDRILEKSLRPIKIIITEGVFSMEGDVPDIPRMLELAEKHRALSIVDDAHATGTIGERGGGTVDYHFGYESKCRKPDIIIGTLGKALASHGAFVLASEKIIDYLINFSRAFIFSTGISPSAAAASLEAINIIEENPSIVKKLGSMSDYARKKLRESGFDILSSNTHIIPILIGNEEKAVDAEKRLLADGIYLKAVRYPTVAMGSARLRLSINASLSLEEIDFVIDKLKQLTKNG